MNTHEDSALPTFLAEATVWAIGPSRDMSPKQEPIEHFAAIRLPNLVITGGAKARIAARILGMTEEKWGVVGAVPVLRHRRAAEAGNGREKELQHTSAQGRSGGRRGLSGMPEYSC